MEWEPHEGSHRLDTVGEAHDGLQSAGHDRWNCRRWPCGAGASLPPATAAGRRRPRRTPRSVLWRAKARSSVVFQRQTRGLRKSRARNCDGRVDGGPAAVVQLVRQHPGIGGQRDAPLLGGKRRRLEGGTEAEVVEHAAAGAPDKGAVGWAPGEAEAWREVGGNRRSRGRGRRRPTGQSRLRPDRRGRTVPARRGIAGRRVGFKTQAAGEGQSGATPSRRPR